MRVKHPTKAKWVHAKQNGRIVCDKRLDMLCKEVTQEPITCPRCLERMK